MTENTTIAKRILQFNEALANCSFDLPEGYRIAQLTHILVIKAN